MPENNPSGYNQVSDKSHTQHFLQNLHLGENLRQRQKEVEAYNIQQQQQDVLNEQKIKANEQLLAQAADQAMKDAFAEKEGFRNAISLGTTPSDFSGSQDEIFDVANMLPGQPAPMRSIEYGERTAKNYKGEDVTVGTNEGQQRIGAVKNQLGLKEAESVAEQAGQLLVQEIGARNAVALQDQRGEQALSLEAARAKNAEALQKARDAVALRIANINASARNSAESIIQLPGAVEYAMNSLGTGTKNALELAREGYSKAEIGQIQLANRERGWKDVGEADSKRIAEYKNNFSDFQRNLERFRDLTAQLSNSDDVNLASARGAVEEARAFVFFPSEMYQEFKTLQRVILEQAATANKGRPTEKDAEAIAFDSISLNKTNHMNQEIINRLGYGTVDKVAKGLGVPDDQFDAIFAGTDLEGISALREQYQAPIDALSREQKQKADAQIAIGQQSLRNPEVLKALIASNPNIKDYESALEVLKSETYEEFGVGQRALEAK
jgi:hypothetical protein